LIAMTFQEKFTNHARSYGKSDAEIKQKWTEMHAAEHGPWIDEARSVARCICADKVDRANYPPCPECGVQGCNIHQIKGWLVPKGQNYRADCPIHGVALQGD